MYHLAIVLLLCTVAFTLCSKVRVDLAEKRISGPEYRFSCHRHRLAALPSILSEDTPFPRWLRKAKKLLTEQTDHKHAWIGPETSITADGRIQFWPFESSLQAVAICHDTEH